jgi:ElaB/YqjD/DUF883 family membrane-anchored ribosome-binding protein
MTTTTFQSNDGYNNAISSLKADYETKAQALRDGVSDFSQSTAQRGGKFVKNNPALVISSALVIGLLVGAVIGRRSTR